MAMDTSVLKSAIKAQLTALQVGKKENEADFNDALSQAIATAVVQHITAYAAVNNGKIT